MGTHAGGPAFTGTTVPHARALRLSSSNHDCWRAADVLAECREQAQVRMERRVSWVGAAIIVTVWLLAAMWLVMVVRDLLS